MSHEVVGFAIPAYEFTEGYETGNHTYSGKDNERQTHGPGLVMGCVVTFVYLVFLPPEDKVVKTEHIEGGEESYERHPDVNQSTVVAASAEDFVLGEET